MSIAERIAFLQTVIAVLLATNLLSLAIAIMAWRWGPPRPAGPMPATPIERKLETIVRGAS